MCPDCRLVFRVPQEHDGLGLVCPSCRRMLKIPLAGDRPPPLMMPLAPAARPGGIPAVRSKQRRTKKSRKGEENPWDQVPAKAGRSHRGERRQMLWMLIGGAVLFAMILAGVLVILLGGAPASAPLAAAPPAKPAAPESQPKAGAPATDPRSDAAFLAEAEPLAQKFLDARSIDDLLPVIRNRAAAEARLRRFYPGGTIEAPGMTGFNVDTQVTRHGTITSLKVRTRGYEEKSLAFVATPQGLKIDWESWVGWSDMPWQEFMATKPTTPQVFRLYLNAVDYYNFAFSDDLKWQAYRLSSPDDAHAIYGYVEHGSKVSAALRPPPEVARVQLTLALKFPEHATSNNQVLIENLVAAGWVLETESPP